MKVKVITACLAVASALLTAADKQPPANALPTVIKVVTKPAPSAPAVTIKLLDRHGHGTPHRCGCTHTGGGNIDVAQPTPGTVVITMTGVAVATGHPCKVSAAGIDFDLDQCFEVSFDTPDVKAAKLSVEARIIGLLRSHCKGGGSAEQGKACATVSCGETSLVTVSVPPHSVGGGENLSVNCHEGPVSAPVGPGKHTLHQVFQISAAHPWSVLPCKAASAEFAPDPLWISYWEPFKGAQKKDFGFQVTLKVAAEEVKEEPAAGLPNNAGNSGPKP